MPAVRRKPCAGSRAPEAVRRKPCAGSRTPEAVRRKPRAGSRALEAARRKPCAGSRAPEAVRRKPHAGSRASCCTCAACCTRAAKMISREMPTFLAIVLVLVAVVQGILTYRDALKEVVNREADDSVFAAFWREYHQADQDSGGQHKANV